ncbi:MAG: hypothetical protein FJW88_08940 [Actinobacteria bacterium]|nr:hypothetical protein [Actinomycetota bacterium]
MAAADQAAAVRRALESSGWARGSRLALLDFDVTTYSDDPAVLELVDALYGAVLAPGVGHHVLSLGRASDGERAGVVVALDGVPIVRTTAPSIAFAHLVFEANQQALLATSGVVLHAAAAVLGKVAVVLPGRMGAGKSTLVAGLAAAGAGYLTDEIVALAPENGCVRPYPKPVSLGIPPPELDGITRGAPAGASEYFTGVLVPAHALPGGVGSPTPPGLVVLPTYEPDAPVAVQRLDPVESVVALAEHAFHLEQPGGLRALAEAFRDVPCYRLTGGSLPGAVNAVHELTGRAVASA